jgi:hypothetical protein
MTSLRSVDWKSEQPGFLLLQLNKGSMSMVRSVMEESISWDGGCVRWFGGCGETARVTYHPGDCATLSVDTYPPREFICSL